MKNILFICDFFKPGYKAGGPIQSIYNLCMLIGEKANIKVITQDHDIDRVKYDLPKDTWIDRNLYIIIYLKKSTYLRSFFTKKDVDLIYLNSFFSLSTQLFLFFHFLSLRNIFKGAELVLATRGEFDPGALMIKANKKRIFLNIFKLIKIKNLGFHATTIIEARNIELVFGKKYLIEVAPNVPKPPVPFKKKQKVKYQTDFYFLSRISPKKNLKFALEILTKLKVPGELRFNIIGPIEDARYWEECNDLINLLPDNIVCNYKGEIANDFIDKALECFHYFFFPTLGENYGHVIYESLALGKPILISDQTPWESNGFDNGVFSFSLREESNFLSVIEMLHSLDEENYNLLSEKAYEYSKQSADFNKIINDYINLFKLNEVTK
jgi:glycosyltransferase involved in cell wall biosynthesis